MKKACKKVLNFISGHKVRLALGGVLIAILFVAPVLTQAQYVWKLNAYTIVQAKEFYFDSNYMHDATKKINYHTTGWDGVRNPIKDIEIRNFENSLLSNKEGENAEYVFTWSIETYKALERGPDGKYIYEKITDSDKMYKIGSVTKTPDTGEERIYTIGVNTATGTLVGDGTPNKDVFAFTIVAPSEALPWNSYIKVTLNARNVTFLRDESGIIITDGNGNAKYKETDSYTRKISCTFEFVMTSSSGFITRFDPEDVPNYKDMKLYVGTGASPDMSGKSQTITVWWDNTKLDINPFNITFTTMIQKGLEDGVNYYKAEYSESLTGISSLTITGLGSNATRTLDFYKLGDNKTEEWFDTEEKRAERVAYNIWPTDSQAAGKYIGYYVEEATETE